MKYVITIMLLLATLVSAQQLTFTSVTTGIDHPSVIVKEPIGNGRIIMADTGIYRLDISMGTVNTLNRRVFGGSGRINAIKWMDDTTVVVCAGDSGIALLRIRPRWPYPTWVVVDRYGFDGNAHAYDMEVNGNMIIVCTDRMGAFILIVQDNGLSYLAQTLPTTQPVLNVLRSPRTNIYHFGTTTQWIAEDLTAYFDPIMLCYANLSSVIRDINYVAVDSPTDYCTSVSTDTTTVVYYFMNNRVDTATYLQPSNSSQHIRLFNQDYLFLANINNGLIAYNMRSPHNFVEVGHDTTRIFDVIETGDSWYQLASRKRDGRICLYHVVQVVSVGEQTVEQNAITTFPNPFNSSGVRFTAISNKPSQMRIYDITGREVDRFMITQSTTWKPNSLPSGIYYYSNGSVSGKITYIK